jgi:hypothetical protein
MQEDYNNINPGDSREDEQAFSQVQQQEPKKEKRNILNRPFHY